MRTCVSCGAVWDDAYDFCSFDGGVLDVTFGGPRVIGERYLLEQRVASGAMGVVFRATHLQLGSTVAVKLMQPMKDALVVGLLRFHREAQILGQIKHPNAVLVIDFGVEERDDDDHNAESIPYLVTEFLRGEGLDALLEREGNLSLDEVAKLIVPMCEAVHEAHEVGVIHRDIKPSNVFLERLRDGSTIVKVLDFGIAKFVEVEPSVLAKKRAENAQWALRLAERQTSDADTFLDEVAFVRGDEHAPSHGAGANTSSATAVARHRIERAPANAARLPPANTSHDDDHRMKLHDVAPRSPPTVTEAGFMVGTIPYMAPEQMTGDPVSRQTDLYAIATLAFQMLTGSLPFEGDDDEMIALKVSALPPSAIDRGADISEALDRTLMQALAMEPSERGDGVLAFANALTMALPAVADDDGDVGLSLSLQIGALSRILRDVDGAVTAFVSTSTSPTTSDHYAVARDRLLALPGPLMRTQMQAARAPERLDDDAKRTVAEEAAELAAAAAALTKSLNGLDSQNEAAEFLRALWKRSLQKLDPTLNALNVLAPRTRSPASGKRSLADSASGKRSLADSAPVGRELADSAADKRSLADSAPVELSPPVIAKNPFAATVDDDKDTDTLATLLALMQSDEDLDAIDAADKVMGTLSEAVRYRLRASSDDVTLVHSLWLHCDRLLLRELYDAHPPRLLPVLAGYDASEAFGFRTLATLFGDIDATEDDAMEARRAFLEHVGDRDRGPTATASNPFGSDRGDNPTTSPPSAEAERFDRCLLLHPSDVIRDGAISRLALRAAWNILLCDRLPLAVALGLFRRAEHEASSEFLKVFFLCTKDLLHAAPDAELDDAFALMHAFFRVDCFHEDVVFEPLLELDQALAGRARASGFDATVPMADGRSYEDVSAAFAAGGTRETKLESLRDIPLAVQRKLAREGHFVQRFMSHPLDKVALETLPHLVRREDVARYLRVPTIHRSVITELAKVRRLFRKDRARLALLQNPKTPANVARIYLPLLPHAQVQLLSRNKHISADVRALALLFAEKIRINRESVTDGDG